MLARSVRTAGVVADRSDGQDRAGNVELHLVNTIGRRHAGYGLPLGDLILQGHLGLMHAVAKFDPDCSVHFATFETWWIRAPIRHCVLHSGFRVKMGTPALRRQLILNLRRVEEEPLTLEALSREYGISRERVRQIENRAYDKLRKVMLQAAHGDWTRTGEPGCAR